MKKNEIIKFLCSSGGTLILTVAMYIFSFLFMSLLGWAGEALMGTGIGEVIFSIAGVAAALIWVYFGWKALTFITPRVFLIMPLVGWVAYFCIKGLLAVVVGIFVAPYYLAKKVTAIVQDYLPVLCDEDIKEHKQSDPNDLMSYTKSELAKFSMDELNNIYTDLSDIVFLASDKEPDSKRVPKTAKSYGCKTLGEARYLLDLIVDVEKIKIAQKQPVINPMEIITDDEKRQLEELGKLDIMTKAYNNSLKGDVKGMLFIAITYNRDLKNPKKSFYWMKKAADKRDDKAEYFLGTYYLDGYGVAENKNKGISLILNAAENGNKDAIHFCMNKLEMTAEQMRECDISI